MNELALKISKNPILETTKRFPRWACDERNNWMAVRELEIDDMPQLQKVEAFIAMVESKKCTVSQAASFSKELKDFFPGDKDKRFQSKRFSIMILNIFMNYPVSVGDEAVNQIIKRHKWFPAPVEIEQILNVIYSPILAPLNRAKHFRRRYEQLTPKPKGKPTNEQQRLEFENMNLGKVSG